MGNDYGEPWKNHSVDDRHFYPCTEDREGYFVADFPHTVQQSSVLKAVTVETAKAREERARLCVNACAGISNERLGIVKHAEELLDRLRDVTDSLAFHRIDGERAPDVVRARKSIAAAEQDLRNGD